MIDWITPEIAPWIMGTTLVAGLFFAIKVALAAYRGDVWRDE